MFGGNNTDTADYSARDGGVSVTLGDSAKGDGAPGEGDDAASDIEKLNGGAGADNLVGDTSGETFTGGPGDDRFDGGRGADNFIGGDGTDTLDYSSRTAAVIVDSDNSGDDGESGERDNARTDVEVVLGGSGNDRLTGGTAMSNRISGGRGDDTLKGGGTGPDVLIGGDGRDTADYADRTVPVYVSLGDGANDGQAWEADDVWGDVESVRGGSADDRLIGNEGANTLTGNDGNDFLAGADGDDRLTAGNGEDVLQGGPGADDIDGGGGGDTIDFGDRFHGVTIDLESDTTSDGDDLGDDIEAATGGGGDDRIVGGGSGSTLAGAGGNDSIDGGGGADVIAGGDGADTADYSRRGASVLVTLDGNPDDGQSGENDNVQPDVEAVLGGTAGDSLTGSGAPNTLAGGEGDDRVAGLGGDDTLQGAGGDDELAGGLGLDRIEAGPGSDYINSRDGVAEFIGCGLGRDGAKRDKSDRVKSCEQDGKPTPPSDGSSPTPPRPGGGGMPGVNVHIVRKRGKIVGIPGFPGERVDRRLVRDIKWLRAKYKIHVTDGYATSGHAPNGEHPLGLGLDIVPGAGGSWNDIDRLAKFAEPSQNRPRAPWRWVGYNGDANHGRGNHLHLSWNHAPARPGRTAAWVQVLTGKPRPSGSAGDLRTLARASNQSRGGVPHVKSRIRSVKRCSGARPLVPTWKAAAKSFGLRWQILAAITQVESAHGCNMGPSSAGAIGWTQFMPATWSAWGMDANGDGKASPYNSVDAIFSSARYLRASGAPGNYRRALFAYNHATWYVNLILRTAKQYKAGAGDYDAADAPQPLSVRQKSRAQTVMSDRGLGFKSDDPAIAPYLKPAINLPPSADETLYPGARR
jgi:Ca2+-binding RTX toxin-like protein